MRLFFILSLLLVGSRSYKILVYSPRYSQSISNFLGNIADTLADAGHNVTTLVPIIDRGLSDATYKSKLISLEPTDELEKMHKEMEEEELDLYDHNNFNPFIGFMVGYGLSDMLVQHCEAVLDRDGLIKQLTDEHFDVMIVESLDACGIGLSHVIKPNAFITSSASIPFGDIRDEFVMDSALSYNPNIMVTHVDVHSFCSRLWNIFAEIAVRIAWTIRSVMFNRMFRQRFGNSFPTIKQISSNAACSFINSEPLVDFAVPTLTRVHYIGGIGAKEPQRLNKDLDDLLNLRQKTVLMAFGSIVRSDFLPSHVKDNIAETLALFPDVTFIWKYESPNDEFAQKLRHLAPNVNLLKWLPQNDLLADDRLTAFITHGGMASTQEATLRGKPCLIIPFMGDQFRNGGMLENSGVGKVFANRDLRDQEKFHSAVKDLLENKRYRISSARIAEMIKRSPFSALDKLIRNVEFAAEFGATKALRPASFDMSFIEYHNLDIITISLIIITILLFLVVHAFRVAFISTARKLKSKQQ